METTFSHPVMVTTAPERSSPLLYSLRWAAAALARPLTSKEIADVAVKGAMMAVDAHAGLVALAAPDGRALRRVHDVGRSSVAPGLLARFAHARRPTFLREAHDVRSSRGALVALPLKYAERRLGVIILAWSRARDFSADERAVLGVLADQCSLALAHETTPGGTWRVGDMEIDPAGNRVVIDGRPVHLTPAEFHMLVLLAEEPGRCRSRKELLSHLWHTEHVGDERACDAHLANLRKKIERNPSRPERLVTVRGLGYALRAR